MADMFGGGMLTTMAKHSAMDRARDQAHEAHQAILHFQQELAVRRCDDRLASVRREHQALTEERVRLIEATELMG